MSLRPQRGYHFASAAQWNACLVTGGDRVSQNGQVLIQPVAALHGQSTPAFASEGARAPAYTRFREALWRDRAGNLHRLPHGDDEPHVVPTPAAIARASRLVATGDALWAVGRTDGTVACFDLETLSRRFVVEIPEARVLDIAGNGRGGIFVIAASDRTWRVVAVDRAGIIGANVQLDEMSEPAELAYLREPDRIVVLSSDRTRIVVFRVEGDAPERSIRAVTLAPCFVACHIASDARARVYVAGVDRLNAPKPLVVVLDESGLKLDEVALSEPAKGLAASRDGLLVAGENGLYVLRRTDTVPDATGEVATTVVTPVLEGADTEDGRRWLRVEATASLPAGSSLEISYAATDDAAVRDARPERPRDVSLSAAQRAAFPPGADALQWSAPIIFHGSDASVNDAQAPLAVPLHDVRARFLWVALSLAASAGGKLPRLSRLSVLYPGVTLMSHLPAIYQREEAKPRSFIRTLVGVLETTTQDLDARIAEMGRHIHPDHAPAPWLDYVARWLGLPWDDALGVGQKRCIVKRAARIARGRGTRAGLEALLECVTRRFRVVDVTADYGMARIGGGECDGTALPAMLGGLPATSARLDVQATLGTMRLPCPGDTHCDATSRFLGRIRVDVAATAAERATWQPWLARLVTEMIPVGTDARVRWTSESGLRGDRLDESFTLENEPAPRLGTDAITGAARLPRTGSTLPTSGAGAGPILE